MNVSEIIRSKPNVAVTGMVNYLTDLAAEMGVDISKWDVNEIFKSEENESGLTHSRTEINKRFFSRIKEEQAKLEQKGDLKLFTEEQIKQLDKAEKEYKKGLRQLTENRIQEIARHISSHEKSIEGYSRELKEAITLYKGDDFSLRSKILEVVEGGFFEFFNTESLSFNYGTDTAVRFITRPVTLSYTRSDREFRLPMGQYKVEWIIRNNTLRCFPYKDNLFYSSYISPFINGVSGGICFGSSKATVFKLLGEGRLREVFAYFEALLTKFSPEGGPMVAIETFDAHGTIDGKPWKQWLEDKQNPKSVGAEAAPLSEPPRPVDVWVDEVQDENADEHLDESEEQSDEESEF